MTLHVAKGLDLPDDAATRRQAILATSGAGKSNAAVVMAEQMYDAGIPWVAIDPKGDWWGIRSDESGEGPGLAIPVLGGMHGDVPLDPSHGHIIGRMIADRHLTCVLDVSEFDTRQDGFRFLADLAESLLRHNRTVLHLFLEEADEYLPQKPGEKGHLPRCVGAWGRLIRRGRQRGIGSTLISQRSAVVSKDVLYLAEALYAMRIAAKADRDTITGWLTHKRTDLDLHADLPALDDGEAFVISPGWLKRTDRIQFYRRRTFDSGATPIQDEDAAPATLADVDLAVLKDELAEAIDRAAADDPVLLRAEIGTLKRDLDKAGRELAAALDAPPVIETEIVTETVEVEVVPAAFVAALRGVLASIDAHVADLTEARDRMVASVDAIETAEPRRRDPKPAGAGRREGAVLGAGPAPTVPPRPAAPSRPVARPRPSETPTGALGDLGNGAARRMLEVLAQYPEGRSRRQLAAEAGVRQKASTVRNAMTTLRKGYVVENGDLVTMTPAAARLVAGWGVSDRPTGPALLDHWRAKLGGTEGAARRVFDFLVEQWPDGFDRATVARAVGIDPETSTIRNALSKLRRYDLLDESDGFLRANSIVMETAGRRP